MANKAMVNNNMVNPHMAHQATHSRVMVAIPNKDMAAILLKVMEVVTVVVTAAVTDNNTLPREAAEAEWEWQVVRHLVLVEV